MIRQVLDRFLRKGGAGPMTNEYEVANVIELGKAEDVVLGEKELVEVVDSQTLEFGTRYIPATNE